MKRPVSSPSLSTAREAARPTPTEAPAEPVPELLPGEDPQLFTPEALTRLLDRYSAVREASLELEHTRDQLAAQIKALVARGFVLDNGFERAEVKRPVGVEYDAAEFAAAFGAQALTQVAKVNRQAAEKLAAQGEISPEKLKGLERRVARTPSLVLVESRRPVAEAAAAPAGARAEDLTPQPWEQRQGMRPAGPRGQG